MKLRLRRLLALALTLPLTLAALGPARADESANLTQAQAAVRSESVREVSYRLELELREQRPSYEGVVTIDFELVKVPPRLHLDFQGEHLQAVSVNQRVVAGATIEAHKVWIPAKLLRRGANRIRIAYRNDFDTDGAGLHKVVDPGDGREYVYTDFEPYDANRLFPCFDQPDLRASYELVVRAPETWTVVANGRELSQTPAGTLLEHRFAPTLRFSTYIMALCAGPYAVWTDPEAKIPARILSTRAMAEHVDADRIFAITRQGFEFFQEYFDIPYPFEKYDQIFLPQFNAGAMENVACVTFNERMIYRHQPTDSELMGRANTILHEMAHMWFGDIVTMRWWNDLWLNESFATYMANLALTRATRFDDAWDVFAKGTKSWAYWQDQLPTTHPIETEVGDTQTTFTNFDGITYGKGASVLKQLAFFVGEEAFREGTAKYLKRFAFGNATRKDFMGSIAAAAGKDLDEWTRLWLQKSGVNSLRPEYRVDDRGRVAGFRLVQGEGNGDGVLRPHRLKVASFRLRGKELRKTSVVTVEVAGASTPVPELDGAEAPDFVYANDEDHAYAKVFLDDRSLRFAREHLELLPDVVKAGVWNAVWFMVRDKVAPPTDYLELFLAKAPLEANQKLLDSFRYSLPDALDAYLPGPLRGRYVDRVQAVAWEAMKAAEPGSDLQKTWFRYLILSAESPEGEARLAGMLSGEVALPKLEVDQERRWQMVTKLCEQGHERALELLAAEEARDPGERGKKAAYEARVALPDPAGKEAAWKQFLEDSRTPLDHLKAGMASFFRPTQEALTRPYVEKFFRALPEVLRDRDAYFVRAFSGSLFPDHVEPGVLRSSERALSENQEWPYYLRRRLLEANDELSRSLEIRSRLR